jgi:TPP-dependent pyruvate/acetoin dehydrogenase alpha subunit
VSQDAVNQIKVADAALQAADPSPFPLPAFGLEAIIAGGFLGVEKTDWVFPGLRERVGGVLRNCPLERLVDGHAGARPYRIAPVSTSASTRLLQACGVAMADANTVLCFIGQGAAATGAFYEALNMASLHQLNLIILAHSRDLNAEGSPLAPQVAQGLLSKAESFVCATAKVSGSDFSAIQKAVANARKARGPHLIEAVLS